MHADICVYYFVGRVHDKAKDIDDRTLASIIDNLTEMYVQVLLCFIIKINSKFIVASPLTCCDQRLRVTVRLGHVWYGFKDLSLKSHSDM